MLLKELSEAIGVSGEETAVRKIVLDSINDHVDNLRIDSLGNVTAIKKGTSKNLPRVMLAAHMDEIGFMVMGYEKNGLIRFTNIGGVDERILPGLRVKIGEKQIPGVIIWKPIHKGRDQNVVKLSNLRIDVGATSKENAKSQVKRGDRIAFDSTYMEIGETTLRGKSFDDRVGCSLLVDVLQSDPYPVDILAAFTVQEEIGLRGAKVAASILNPDIAFALEGTPAHDLPLADSDPHIDSDISVNPACKLGDGPVLTVMDSRIVTDPRILTFLKMIARENNIPFQLKTRRGGGTDVGAIHISNTGVPSSSISVPCRYIHSPSALLNRNDYHNSLALIRAVLNNITSDILG